MLGPSGDRDPATPLPSFSSSTIWCIGRRKKVKWDALTKCTEREGGRKGGRTAIIIIMIIVVTLLLRRGEIIDNPIRGPAGRPRPFNR